MVRKVLVETGFLLALNPKDKHHRWAFQALEEAKRGDIQLFISEPSILELNLILKARGVDERSISALLESLNAAIRLYTKLNYAHVTFEVATLASQLRRKYLDLTFFDSYHAALAIAYDLEYYDLDPLVRRVVSENA